MGVLSLCGVQDLVGEPNRKNVLDFLEVSGLTNIQAEHLSDGMSDPLI
jgi:hypothetical protein